MDVHHHDRVNWIATGIVAVLLAGLAVVFRLPSITESFWIDELHSTWTVAEDFSQVSPRATVGNQTTGYFHLLWFWRQIAGESEVALRLSSVLINALTVALLVVAVVWQTGRISGGAAAGLLLATGPNAVFFGTELRPYALVMLFAVLAAWSALCWTRGSQEINGAHRDRSTRSSRGRSFGGARWRLAMLFGICAGALIHPTSLGVLAMLIPLSCLLAWKRGRFRVWRADVLALIVVFATIVALATSSLPDSWVRRGQWRAFGVATDFNQLWYAWAWIPLVIIPAAVAMIAWIGRSGSEEKELSGQDGVNNGVTSDWWLPGLAGVLGTLAFFGASYLDVVPLWHRRYFVSALPLLVWTAGAAASIPLLNAAAIGPAKARCLSWAQCAAVVLIAFWYQGTLQSFSHGKVPVQYRGEGWREAVAHVQSTRASDDAVWLDTGLIEDQFLRFDVQETGGPEHHDWEYLAFPVGSVYRIEDATVVSVFEHSSWLRLHLASLNQQASRIWLISRSADRFVEPFGQSVGTVLEKRRFGNVVVIAIGIRSAAESPESRDLVRMVHQNGSPVF